MVSGMYSKKGPNDPLVNWQRQQESREKKQPLVENGSKKTHHQQHSMSKEEQETLKEGTKLLDEQQRSNLNKEPLPLNPNTTKEVSTWSHSQEYKDYKVLVQQTENGPQIIAKNNETGEEKHVIIEKDDGNLREALLKNPDEIRATITGMDDNNVFVQLSGRLLSGMKRGRPGNGSGEDEKPKKLQNSSSSQGVRQSGGPTSRGQAAVSSSSSATSTHMFPSLHSTRHTTTPANQTPYAQTAEDTIRTDLLGRINKEFAGYPGTNRLMSQIRQCDTAPKLHGYEFQLDRMQYYKDQGKLKDFEFQYYGFDVSPRYADIVLKDSSDQITHYVETKNFRETSWDTNLEVIKPEIMSYVKLADTSTGPPFILESKHEIPYPGRPLDPPQSQTALFIGEILGYNNVEVYENLGSNTRQIVKNPDGNYSTLQN